MLRKKLNIFFAVIIFLLFTFACNAPRENPVDPNNSDYKLSSINGVVKAHGYPFKPIKNVDVLWENDNMIVATNNNGEYEFLNVYRNNGWVKFKCEGYIEDSTFIDWKETTAVINEIFLNSKPKLDSLEFFSVVKNRWEHNQIYNVQVRARVSDYEGVNDIVNVIIENKELNIHKILSYNHIENFYEGTLFLTDLNIKSLNEIIGKDFNILVEDLEEKIFNVGITNIKRVINEEIELISPKNSELVTNQLRLKWTRFTPGYSFTYKVEIKTNEASPILVYSEENIAQDSISLSIDSNFEGSNFHWVIWAIDEFKNQARSKPGTFTIEN